MDKGELRQLVLEVLRRDPQTHLNAVEFQVRSLADNYDRHDALTIHEIIWELLIQGVLAPGKNSLNLNLPFFHVTDYGDECLESGAILLYDYDHYLHDLEASIDELLDPIIRAYVHAAQKGFLSGNYLATMSLLADAGSRCIDMLADMLDHVQHQDVARGEQTPRAGLERIRVILTSLHLKEELREEVGLHLQGLENLIGHTHARNGRPLAVSIGRQSAQGALLLFPQYVGTTYRLIAGFRDRSRG